MLTNYFTLLSQEKQEDGSILSKVRLNPDCEVYKGHFPGDPVCPGVCNLQMVRECVEHYLNKSVTITDIKQCRYTALITPVKQSVLYIKATLTESEGGYIIVATVYDDNESFIELKGTLSVDS